MYDLDSVDGLAESAFAGVSPREPLPAILIFDDDGEKVLTANSAVEVDEWLTKP